MADDAAPAPAEIARLRAEAAQAAAVAAEARAQAAQAALDAALAAAAGGAAQPAAPSPAAPTQPAPAQPTMPQPATAEPELTLGALMPDGVNPDPAAQVGIGLAMLNRHGLVAGATGTGKTRTLQLMAEELSAAGVPVFLTDIKGDLTGLAVPGEPSEGLLARTRGIGQDWAPVRFPVELFSLGGVGTGVPIRTAVTDFGPLLLSKVLGLNETQESSLQLIFHWADSQGLALLDLKDLRATVDYLTSEEGKPELKGIGGISTATAGVILRELSALQAQGAEVFFGEPAFETADLLRTDPDGRGVISALQLPALQDRPTLFSTFVMWLLAELFATLPEVGDLDKPRLVFFFDEAHLLFTDASPEFLAQVVQTVRLIRSKGVGIFFVTQTPQDVPADVLAQLGARVQHALRAFTPKDADALRATVRTFPTSEHDLEKVLTSLGTGEAVVTALDEKGRPTPVSPTRIRAPRASMAPAPTDALDRLVATSPLAARYTDPVDRESAHELLQARVAQQEDAGESARKRARELEELQAEIDRDRAGSGRSRRTSRSTTSPLDSFLRSAGTQLGREITRTIFGTRRRR